VVRDRERIYLSPPTVGGEEMAFLADAVASNWIAPLGPHVDAFERELAARAGVSHGAALDSGTAALHLALEVLGVGPGDPVYCSTLTFAASANAIAYCGASPVFLDSDRATWNLDPALLAEALEADARRGALPRAVLVVDAYGQCADYGPIAAACARYGVPIVEDAAESLGATYRGRPAGSFGAMAAFSFNGNKIITTSGGGMLVADDPAAIARARHLATQAREATDDNHYLHREVGHNYRMSNLLAAVGRAQLRQLDGWVARRRALFDRYRALLGDLPGLEFMPEIPGGTCTRWLSCVLIDPPRFGADRRDVQRALAADDIESRPVWRPMHTQPAFAGARAVGGAVAEDLYRRGLCLPSGPTLTDSQQDRIADLIRSAARR
jgi:dTDP-4-amino-4,6-dideoxygalactose transaminase